MSALSLQEIVGAIFEKIAEKTEIIDWIIE